MPVSANTVTTYWTSKGVEFTDQETAMDREARDQVTAALVAAGAGPGEIGLAVPVIARYRTAVAAALASVIVEENSFKASLAASAKVGV